jgi:beta-glucosidase
VRQPHSFLLRVYGVLFVTPFSGRWGRTEETYGEDPFLNGMLAIAAVKGLQGTHKGKVARKNVAATLKHFTGHGESEGGQNQGSG